MTPEEQDTYIRVLKRIEACRREGGTRLDLSRLDLVALPPEIWSIGSLSLLDLGLNRLEELPPEIGNLGSLRSLYLSNNQLKALPPEIGQLGCLMKLDLSNNQLEELPPEIGSVGGLRSLDLSNNQLEALPPEIGQLGSLRLLSLSTNQLGALPPEIGKLGKLTELYLANNPLEELPPEIGNLGNLTAMDLSNNRLVALPPEIGRLGSLRLLSLFTNQLGALPPEIGKLGNLKELYLSNNPLEELPPEIGSLGNLTVIDLSNNRLGELPPEIGNLGRLKEMKLSRNKLGKLPPEIGNLRSLRGLDLSRNQLVELPPEIGNLGNMARLAFYANQLGTLPPEIGSLWKLTELYLGRNQLVELPPEIGNLTGLEILVLESNAFRELPESLKKLKNLKYLTLHRNEALGLPVELLGPTWRELLVENCPPANPQAILDFYLGRKEQGVAPMQEVRVLLVGRGRVGKTSLLKVLQGRKPDEFEPETPGITVEDLALDCPQGRATAHVWDFGGQEFLHGTHQIFLSERCVYVLVLEGREGNWETETDYWLRFIQSFGGDSPVVVALNKYDKHPFSVDRYRLQERCPQIVGFVETDAFAGLGVEGLRGLLEKTVDGMRDVWLGVPRKWHEIKDALEKMPESYLEYGAYAELCVRHGLTEPDEQDSLAVSLHRLGIALNFRDHQRLRHTSVLKPKWVTEAIYGLIRFTKMKDCHGVLLEDWLPQALQPAADYPASMHGFVVDLMAKFEVAFPLEEKGHGGQERWLIPELLGETQPEAFGEFRGGEVQRLRFTYPDALPPGLLPRFIVRTHEMSEAHPKWRWRSGVVLEWLGGRALVRLDRLERRTEVSVIECPLPDQQSLFDIIRAHLIVLHGNVRCIEETEVGEHPGVWVKVEKLRSKKRRGEKEIEEFVDGERKEIVVEVRPTLERVESDAATEAAGPDPQKRMHLFISYAHANEKELLPFRQHLTLLSQRGYIQVWHDRDLVAEEKWEKGIKEELNRAEIVLVFYTTAARVSRFIQMEELPVALDRADRGECTIIWVPLERNDLDNTHPQESRLADLLCATCDARTIYSFEPPQLGWMQVEAAICSAVEKRRKNAAGVPRKSLRGLLGG